MMWATASITIGSGTNLFLVSSSGDPIVGACDHEGGWYLAKEDYIHKYDYDLRSFSIGKTSGVTICHE